MELEEANLYTDLNIWCRIYCLKKAMEESVTIRYHLCSMGVQITKLSLIWIDSMGIVLNASNPGSTLNKKLIALAYHFVQESMVINVVKIRKIDSSNNYANPKQYSQKD